MKLPHKSGRWILGVLVCVFLYFFLTGNDGLINIIRSRHAVNRMEKDFREQKAVQDSLKKMEKLLKNDTAYMEKTAREKLGMAKKNEKVYKFVDE